MLDAVKPLVEAGFAVHWLREKSKAPFTDAWTSEPVYSFADLQGHYRAGLNVGVRLGEPSKIGDLYLHVIDLDIRDPARADEAKARLRDLLPDVDTFPTVISGSGGESRHFYLVSPAPFRSKKLAHSDDKITGKDGKQHWAYEIELFGTGKQVAMPPSIHPETGRAYRWDREIDFDLIDMGLGPVVPAETITRWVGELGKSRAAAEDEDDDLAAVVHKQPMGLSKAEIQATLADLPLADWCEDRDGWLNVGMALHHEFQGSDEGLEAWNQFSSQSKKFNKADQARVWRSFRISSKSMRFAILLKAAAEARLKDDLGDGFENLDDDPIGDVEDGDVVQSAGDDDPIGEVVVRSALQAPALEWVSKLDRSDEGAIKPTLHNLELIVANDSRLVGVIALNEFTGDIVQRGTPGIKVVRKPSPKGTKQLEGPIWKLRDPVNGDLWSEEKDNAIRALFEAPTRQGGYGIKVSDRDLKAAIDIVAQDKRFHPVREFLNGLKWDGKPRLETMFVRFLGAADNAYSRTVARLTLVGGVTRVMEPGHKFDFATILEGLQGRRKSTFIEILAKHWFSELDGDFHDPKQMIEAMQGSWVLEIPELSGFGRADVRQIKAFISRKQDKARLAYAHRARVFPRQCIFIGSTNDREYLRDDTGGRRFWPMVCSVTDINTDALGREVDQLWAEATVLYNEMRAVQPFGNLPLYITDDSAKAEAAKLQEDRRIEGAEDAMAGRIAGWLDTQVLEGSGFEDEDDVIGGGDPIYTMRNATCLLEIWVECFRRDEASYGQIQAQQLGRAIGKIPGWYKDGQTRTEKYGKQRIFRRVGSLTI